MIAARWTAAVAILAATLGSTAAEASPRKPKPITKSYDFQLPVPWAMEDPSGSHCATAPEGLSKATVPFTLPSAGKLSLELKNTVGDWVMEVSDPKGRRVGMVSTFGSTGAQMVVKYKGRNAQKYTIAVCNYAGGPTGTLTLTYVFA